MSVVVVMPSRGRPERARSAIDALRRTTSLVSTALVLVVDADDPLVDEYRRLRWSGFGPETWLMVLEPEVTGDLVRATNTASLRVIAEQPDAIVANLGDDHLSRTWGWDEKMIAALATPGIAYGDDRLQGENLPTAPFISPEIIRALGWYALPTCHHLFIDDAWKALGIATGTLRYVPEVVIEHEHPATGRVEWDDGYERANNQEATARDKEAFDRWRNTTFYDDVNNVRRALDDARRTAGTATR